MKLSRCLCIAALALMVGCAPEFQYEVKPSADTLELSRNSVKFAAGEASEVVEFEASGEVKVAIEESAGWISAEIEDGKLKITAEANPEITLREGKLTVSCGELSYDVKVEQLGMNIAFAADPDELKFGCEKSSVTVSIASNLSWTVAPNADWVTPSVYEGEKNVSIVIEVPSNVSLVGRSALIDFYHGDERVGRIPVTQEPVVPVLTVSKDALTGDEKGWNEPLSVSANWPWKVYTSAADSSWITLTSPAAAADGLIPAGGSQTVKVDVAPTKAARDGEIIFDCAGNATKVSVHQDGELTVLNISKSSFSFSSASSSQTFTITTNNVWEITNLPSWITASKLSGEAGTEEVTLTAAKREGSARTATFNVVSGGQSLEATISQEAGAYTVKIIFCPWANGEGQAGFLTYIQPVTSKFQSTAYLAYNEGVFTKVLKSDSSISLEFYSSHGPITSNTKSGLRFGASYKAEIDSKTGIYYGDKQNWPFYYNHDPEEKDPSKWVASPEFGVSGTQKIIRKVTVEDGVIKGDEDFAYIKFPAIEGLRLTKVTCWFSASDDGKGNKQRTCITTDVSVSNEDAYAKAVSDVIFPVKDKEIVYTVNNPQYNTPYYMFMWTNNALVQFYNIYLYYEP